MNTPAAGEELAVLPGGHLPEAEALALALALRRPLGITRIADLTGLDRIGIPVAQATRPFALSNAVSQGKGLSAAQAVVSAIMECAETFCAERLDRFAATQASADALEIPAGRFDGHVEPGVGDWRGRRTAWVEADDLLRGGRAMVPLDLVHTAYLVPDDSTPQFFVGSTTGLAAGFAEPAATEHALLECIERDALVRAHRTHGFLQRLRIDPATIRNRQLLGLLAVLGEKGLLAGLWQMPSPTGVPAIWCHVMEDSGPAAILPYPSEGTAARREPAAAALAAILEALQSRLAAISGAREDITRAQYPKYPDRQAIAAHGRLLAEGPRPLHFDALARPAGCGDAVADLLSALDAGGADAVLRVRIDADPLPGLSVVKLVVPSLLPFREN